MADTTKDIWNDDDGEEPSGKPHRLRRFFVFFLTLVAVLGIVLVAAYRDGTGFDVLRRYLTYGTVETAAEDVHYRYDASSNNRFVTLGDTLVVLSKTSLQVLGQDGSVIWSTMVKMDAPALEVGGGSAVAYDVGGTELYVVGPEGERMRLTADPAEPFIAATLNENGYLAVTSEKKTYKGMVHVYDNRGGDVFEFNSSRRFVTDAYVTRDNAHLAVVTLGQEDSVFVSNVVLYDLSQKDPVANYNVADGLVLSIQEKAGQLLTVSDTCLTLADTAGAVQSVYDYGGAYLREYDAGGEDFTVLLLNRYQYGTVGRLVSLGEDGSEAAVLDVNEEILGVSAAGRYIAVLYSEELVIYNRELQVYATLEDAGNTRDVLLRSDGSALLLAADSARLFLP